MCGIHFILDKQQQLSATSPAIHHMMQESAYRGPDAADTLFITHTHHHVWLGSNRLKITDPHDRANQPFSSADGRYHLLYNGEIYNYYELRNQLLSQGQTFTTQSDTEVLLHWLIQKGTAGIAELNGMFAFVLYDQHTGTVWAARDRCGMKPLYFYEDKRYLLLSSEAKSIMASGLVKKVFRAESVEHYCRFKYTEKPHTFFQGVQSFPEGHWCESTGGDMRVQAFTTLPANGVAHPTTPLSEETLLSELEALLRDAVLHHVAPDVPTGLFLSGGVDSTLLLALLQKEGVPVMTFSMGHEEQSGSFGTKDYRYARLAAEQYGTYHQEFTISLAQWEETFEEFVRYLDQPVGDSGAFMTFMLAREAKRSVKVVLSGTGADELFAGYHRHEAFYQYLRHYRGMMRSLPWWQGVARRLPTGTPHPWRKQFRLLRKLGQDITSDPAETFNNFLTFRTFDEPFKKTTSSRRQIPSKEYQAEFVENYLHDALSHDRAHYLVSDVLRISDNMSMAQGVEMRLPYLDAEIIDWIDQRSATVRLLHGRKWLLNRILEQYGGKKFTERRKEGLGLPFGHWLRTRSLAPVEKYLGDPHQPVFRYLDFERIQHWQQRHQRGQADFSLELWSVLTLSAWISYHFSSNN